MVWGTDLGAGMGVGVGAGMGVGVGCASKEPPLARPPVLPRLGVESVGGGLFGREGLLLLPEPLELGAERLGEGVVEREGVEREGVEREGVERDGVERDGLGRLKDPPRLRPPVRAKAVDWTSIHSPIGPVVGLILTSLKSKRHRRVAKVRLILCMAENPALFI